MKPAEPRVCAMNMNVITIANVNIRQDADGRYCLNDLHRAAGGESKDRPSKWLDADKTQALIAELDAEKPASEQNQALSVVKGGNGWQGTFIVKELVYAYAMWISPAFHLKVIRAYDQLATAPAGLMLPNFTDPAAAAVAWADQYRARQAAEKIAAEQSEQLAIAAPKIEFADAVLAVDEPILIRDAAKSMKVKESLLRRTLKERGILLADGTAAAGYVQKGYLVNHPRTVTLPNWREKVGFTAKITGGGYVYLQKACKRYGLLPASSADMQASSAAADLADSSRQKALPLGKASCSR